MGDPNPLVGAVIVKNGEIIARRFNLNRKMDREWLQN